MSDERPVGIPVDFDKDVYLALNPDVMNAGCDPYQHYIDYGKDEKRRYKLFSTLPRGRLGKKIFFMHIPKTCGTSVNDFFMSHMDGFDHIEGMPFIWENLNNKYINFISAHTLLPDIVNSIVRNDWIVVTLLRDPLAQTISHMRWAKYWGCKEKENEIKTLGQEVIDFIAEFYEISLNDINKLSNFRENNQMFQNFFDNCQTRYMINSKVGLINDDDYENAIANSYLLDFIGFCDDIPKSLSKIMELSGRQSCEPTFKHLNKARLDEFPNLEDNNIMDFYLNLCMYDRKLYQKLFLTHFVRQS